MEVEESSGGIVDGELPSVGQSSSSQGGSVGIRPLSSLTSSPLASTNMSADTEKSPTWKLDLLMQKLRTRTKATSLNETARNIRASLLVGLFYIIQHVLAFNTI